MRHTSSVNDQPTPGHTFEDRWEGPDRGLRTSWLRGIEKAIADTELRDAALRGELPVLAWQGGGKAIKAGRRMGSLHYLAMWQGLRGEDLCVDDVMGAEMTCSLTKMVVTFTGDVAALGTEVGDSGDAE